MESQLLRLARGQAHKLIHPLKVSGRFDRARNIISWILIAILMVTPWTTVNGVQTMLFDIPARKFHLFGTIFWPSDLSLMVFILVGAAIILFLVTALWGRVWCGYACPQTVFMHTFFFPLEDLIEGGRNSRLRRDAGPWTPGRVIRKVIKHGLFLAISAAIGHVTVAYFFGAREMIAAMFSFDWNHAAAIGFAWSFTLFWYWDFAFFRDQMCTYACPYARFQSALLDDESLAVTYDTARGEPRAKFRKGEERGEKGDCIECLKCVNVCPTGIDIRDGSQMECIQCTRCIDACDSVMEAFDMPLGLVRYSTANPEVHSVRKPWLRPRVIFYIVIIAGLTFGLIWQLANRHTVEMTVLRPPGDPFTVMDAGKASNRFQLRVLNKGTQDYELSLSIDGLEGAQLITPISPYPLPAGEVGTIEAFVIFDVANIHGGKQPVNFVAVDQNGEVAATDDARVLGPKQ